MMFRNNFSTLHGTLVELTKHNHDKDKETKG